MGIIIYVIPTREPCLFIQMLAKHIGVEMNVKALDYDKQDHMSASYKKNEEFSLKLENQHGESRKVKATKVSSKIRQKRHPARFKKRRLLTYEKSARFFEFWKDFCKANFYRSFCANESK
ncbi:hypothetical protein HPB48_004821 [Haemaphysalis longicornis]|uniref:Uncharacterized protein n=1 Tax=Haemaphysalis longicornis TaxID=44386 RepID=A0A9J6GL74_HAELO|nr:hypothetical protein HPB48_004821 [Haemaphysalis longicornis]